VPHCKFPELVLKNGLLVEENARATKKCSFILKKNGSIGRQLKVSPRKYLRRLPQEKDVS
jgi:hypothetical protein